MTATKPWLQFQIMLGSGWKDFSRAENTVLNRFFEPNATLHASLRGHKYEYDFGKMVQKNLKTGKTRRIRVKDGEDASGAEASLKDLSGAALTMALAMQAALFADESTGAEKALVWRRWRRGWSEEALVEEEEADLPGMSLDAAPELPSTCQPGTATALSTAQSQGTGSSTEEETLVTARLPHRPSETGDRRAAPGTSNKQDTALVTLVKPASSILIATAGIPHVSAKSQVAEDDGVLCSQLKHDSSTRWMESSDGVPLGCSIPAARSEQVQDATDLVSTEVPGTFMENRNSSGSPSYGLRLSEASVSSASDSADLHQPVPATTFDPLRWQTENKQFLFNSARDTGSRPVLEFPALLGRISPGASFQDAMKSLSACAGNLCGHVTVEDESADLSGDRQ